MLVNSRHDGSQLCNAVIPAVCSYWVVVNTGNYTWKKNRLLGASRVDDALSSSVSPGAAAGPDR